MNTQFEKSILQYDSSDNFLFFYIFPIQDPITAAPVAVPSRLSRMCIASTFQLVMDLRDVVLCPLCVQFAIKQLGNIPYFSSSDLSQYNTE